MPHINKCFQTPSRAIPHSIASSEVQSIIKRIIDYAFYQLWKNNGNLKERIQTFLNIPKTQSTKSTHTSFTKHSQLQIHYKVMNSQPQTG